jgi:hypothetical protein
LLLALAGYLAMVLFLIVALDRPFSGDTGITSDSYRLVYEHYTRTPSLASRFASRVENVVSSTSSMLAAA